jgi:hypothetical protein
MEVTKVFYFLHIRLIINKKCESEEQDNDVSKLIKKYEHIWFFILKTRSYLNSKNKQSHG